MKAMRAQSNLHLVAVLAAALFLPLQVSAAMPTQVTRIDVPTSTMDNLNGWHAMTDADLAGVSAQGLADNFFYQSANTSNTSGMDGLKIIGKLTSSMSNNLNFLDGETTMTDVVYDPSRAKTFANPDGSITQILPASIGEINFDNIRVKGSTPGASFGSISIKAIDFNGTTLTLAPRR